jgi:hypothetical protein
MLPLPSIVASRNCRIELQPGALDQISNSAVGIGVLSIETIPCARPVSRYDGNFGLVERDNPDR